MMRISIDGQSVEVAEGTTVLEAAEQAGIYIPHLCNSPRLTPYGACRMCIVEIEGARGLPTACTTVVSDQMVVHTETEQLTSVRRMTCELLIADHPLECLSCRSNQHCELQKVASHLGISESRLGRMGRDVDIDDSNPFYSRNMSKCILCGLCTRACHELRSIGAIEVAGRGYDSRIAAFGDAPVSQSPCVSCGECVDLCPVGALTAKKETMPPTEKTNTVCPYCGCGCGIELGTRGGKIVQIRGQKDNPVNKGSLCVKGRFGLDFVNAGDRLTKPLIKKDGEFVEVEWDEALQLIADKLTEIKGKDGPDAIAALASAKCTNEDNYLFQKFTRAVIGTNNIDHCARL